MVRAKVMTVMRQCAQDEVNQEESEQNLLQSSGLGHGELGFDSH